MIIPTIPATLLCGDRISRYSNEGQHFGIFQYFISYQILAPAPAGQYWNRAHSSSYCFHPRSSRYFAPENRTFKIHVSRYFPTCHLFTGEAGGAGAGAALKWNFKTDCSSAEAEAGEWIHNTLGCIYVSSSKTSAATLLLSIM